MNAQAKKQGFTIIEVVLVLAIAALIFLMIFVALPALQRGQRDTSRKQDVGKIVSAVNGYRSNTNGDLTGLDSTILQEYIDGELGQVLPASVTVGGTIGGTADDSVVVTLSAKCADDNGVDPDGTDRQASVQVRLEGGTALYCETA